MPRDIHPEPWPDGRAVPAPWTHSLEQPIKFVLAGDGTHRDDIPARRRQAALETLEEMRDLNRPTIEVWSDGAASDGTHNGGAGVIIRWHDGRQDTTISAAAGPLCSSTDAEAAAASIGISQVAEELQGTADRIAIWLLFDSRALHTRLQQPIWCMDDATSRNTALCLCTLARTHDVAVIWVPGHAGLAQNERADAAATAARDHAVQNSKVIPTRSLQLCVSRCITLEALDAYRIALEGHVHLEASAGGRLADFSSLPRSQAVLLHRLRLNRCPGLRATQHRWGLDDSPNCLRCLTGHPDDTRHLLLDCPALDNVRLRTLGTNPSLDILHLNPSLVLDFIVESAVFQPLS